LHKTLTEESLTINLVIGKLTVTNKEHGRNAESNEEDTRTVIIDPSDKNLSAKNYEKSF
jgi:hypothetical protein